MESGGEKRGGIHVLRGECERQQNEERSSAVVIHQGLLILWGAIIFKVTDLDCNNVPIATIIFNDYYYGCHKMETGASIIKT